jgi:hypothetical protein
MGSTPPTASEPGTMSHTATILLLGSGELGREFVISAKRLGARVIACDAYDDAPAMQVADAREVFSMLDGAALRAVAEKHRPDLIVPEIEAIRTEVLADLEAQGMCIVPSARAAQLTMNRDAIRDLAAGELGIATSRYRYAETLDEVRAAAEFTGFPCVIKPVMSSSGKGQSTVRDASELEAAWNYAVAGMRGDRTRVIVEAFVDFDYEITLLTIAHAGGVSFCPPIGHRQERGDYQESWQPAPMSPAWARRAGLGPVRRGILRARGRGDFLRVESASARYRHGHPGQPEPVGIRPPRPRDHGAAATGGDSRAAGGVGGDPGRPRQRGAIVWRTGRSAGGRRHRPAHLRQADQPPLSPDGRRARHRWERRTGPRKGAQRGGTSADRLRRLTRGYSRKAFSDNRVIGVNR